MEHVIYRVVFDGRGNSESKEVARFARGFRLEAETAMAALIEWSGGNPNNYYLVKE